MKPIFLVPMLCVGTSVGRSAFPATQSVSVGVTTLERGNEILVLITARSKRKLESGSAGS